MSSISLRSLLQSHGYSYLVRKDAWVECLIRRGSEQWLGRADTEEAAIDHAVTQMLPSAFARGLLVHYIEAALADGAPPPTRELNSQVSTTDLEIGGEPSQAARAHGEDEEASPGTTVFDRSRIGGGLPAAALAAPVNAAQTLAVEAPEPDLVAKPSAVSIVAASPAVAAFSAAPAIAAPVPVAAPVAAPQRTLTLNPTPAPAPVPAPAPAPALAPVPAPAHAPVAEAAVPASAGVPASAVRTAAVARTYVAESKLPTVAEVLAAIDGILADIEDQLPSFSRMPAERQRFYMLAWMARARSYEEVLPRVRDVELAVAKVARRLTNLGKMFWPGSVRALQLSARPSDAKELRLPNAPLPHTWRDAAELADRVLDDHLAKAALARLDEDGWADSASRVPSHPDPDSVLPQIEKELDALLGPDGDGSSTQLAAAGEGELDALVETARKLRWVRGQVEDHVKWGMLLGRMRRAVAVVGDRGGRFKDVLEARYKPPSPWGKLVQARAESEAQVNKTAVLAAALDKAKESKETLAPWLVQAFDTFNSPDLAALLQPSREQVIAVGEVALGKDDRRVRRRYRELVQRLGSMSEAEAARLRESMKEAAPAAAPESVAVESPRLPMERERDLITESVRAFTNGQRALFVSNRDDPDLSAKLAELLGITLTWCDGSVRRVQAQCARIANKSYDLVLSATGFQVHGVDGALAKASSAAGVPYVRVNRGRPLAVVRAISREFGIKVGEPAAEAD